MQPVKRAEDSEKITINLGYVDLGRIDLLVREGFYANRSDFIRTGIRNLINAHGEDIAKSARRSTLEMGLVDLTRADLEAARAAGRMLDLRVVGLARIAADVTPELALATIGSLTILGALQAPPEVRTALADRIR